jgi:hypothetical protein
MFDERALTAFAFAEEENPLDIALFQIYETGLMPAKKERKSSVPFETRVREDNVPELK